MNFLNTNLLIRHLCVLGGLLFALSACSVPAPGATGVHDPYENVNRKTHAVNKGLDRVIVRPVSRVYDVVLPDPVEDGISNVSSNLSLPGKIVNNVLQGDLKGAGQNTLRFLFNTTFGLGGLMDPSTHWDLPAVDADFGQTLAVWGVREGAYIELPVRGPSNERDTVGIVVDMVLDPVGSILGPRELRYRRGAQIGARIQQRHVLGTQIDEILYGSADSYAQTKLIYVQNRRFDLEDGTGETFDDPYIDPYEDIE